MSGGDLLFIFAFLILPTALLVSCIWLYVLLRRGLLLPPRRALPADGQLAEPAPAGASATPASERETLVVPAVAAAPPAVAADEAPASEQTLELTAWQAQQAALAAELQAAALDAGDGSEPPAADLAAAEPASAEIVAAETVEQADERDADDDGDAGPPPAEAEADDVALVAEAHEAAPDELDAPDALEEPAIERTDEHPIVPPAPPIAAAQLLDAAPVAPAEPLVDEPAAPDARPQPPTRRKPVRRPAAARPLDELPRPRLNAALFRKSARHPG